MRGKEDKQGTEDDLRAAKYVLAEGEGDKEGSGTTERERESSTS